MEQIKKTLIIGGSSSICDEIIIYLENNGYSIDLMTYNTEMHKRNIKNYEKYSWRYLNLVDKEGTESIIADLPENYYDTIICVPTYNSGQRNPLETSRDFLEELFGDFIVNYIDLIRNLIFKKLKNNGHFAFISSESANSPTDMHDYAASKATIQAYVRSLSKKADGRTVYVVATTGIYESLPYYQHGEDYYNHDLKRWVRKEQIAKVIVDAKPEDNGKIFTLGFVPSKTENLTTHSGVIYPHPDSIASYNVWHKLI